MRHQWLGWGAVAVVTACASALRRADSSDPTLEVRNGGLAAVDLHLIQGVSVVGDTIGYRLGTVFAGRTECFVLQASTTLQWLRIRSVEGTLHTPSFLSASRRAWRLELTGNRQTDPLALEPAEERCRPGMRTRTD